MKTPRKTLNKIAKDSKAYFENLSYTGETWQEAEQRIKLKRKNNKVGYKIK